MGSKRRRLDSSDDESGVPLARRRRTSLRAKTEVVNYAESSGEEEQVTKGLVTDSELEAEVISTAGEINDDDDDDDEVQVIDVIEESSDGGGFIIAPASSSSAKGSKKKRQSRSNTVTPSTAKSTRRSSEQITPATSEEDELNLLDLPMSSKQGKLLADAVAKSRSKAGAIKAIRLDSDDDDGDADFVAADDDEDEDEYKEEDDDEDKEAKVAELFESQKKPAKKPRRARKQKSDKPKLSRSEQYHQRVEMAMAHFHPETVGTFDKLQNTPKIAVEQAPQPQDLSVKLLPFQLEGINWLRKQEQTVYAGGILADEMGMGKTIQTVSLILTDEERMGPNLVVAPTVAMMQWKNEIADYVGDKLKIYLYYGNNRSANADELCKYDVILTTYAVCESVYRKQVSGFKRKSGLVKEKSVLHNMFFHRIVLDEAHNIKDRTSNTARAVSTIQSAYKLCLSGTPLQNRVGEIYSLIRFLKVEPFCNYYCTKCDCTDSEWRFSDYNKCDNCGHRSMDHPNFFNHSILKFIQREYSTMSASDAMKNLRLLLSQIMLRRTKIERADDLGLPPRIVQVRRDYFNEEERDFYASIYSDSARQFTSYVNEGVVLNNYANIFTLITRMRQVADHPDLVLRRRQDKADARTAFVCKLCDDEAEDAIKSKCHHMFCRLCIREYVEGWTGAEKDLECPVCHIRLSIDLEAAALTVDQDVVKKASVVNRIDMSTQWRSSTKIEALVEELFKLRSDRQTVKSIVFSQFTSMLDLVEWRLNKAGFQCVKLQGSMSPSQRDGIIRHFMETPSVEIFLVSLKAGGVALNLCEASQVFLLDPWWNPSVEWQSGDRVHRIGQHRPVQITRFAIEDSIESRIIELQEKKANMINATIGNDDASMNRLTPADMQFLFTN